jgi:aminoglycoside phosphotransferase (APT) family kinase protein
MAFSEVIDRRRRATKRRMMEGMGLPLRLAEKLEDWMPPTTALMPATEDTVLTLGDLSDDHILGRAQGTSFEPFGIVGLREARLGHPLFDLGPVWWGVLHADRHLLTSFLDEAGLPGATDSSFPRVALAWAMINPGRYLMRLPDVHRVATLDELADRLFG